MPTIPAVLRAAAAAAPDREALVTAEVRLTFAALLDRVRRGSAACVAHGIGHGDRVAIWGPNSVDWAVAALSVTGVGGVVVPVNSRFKGEEARYLLDKAGVSALVVDDDFLTGQLGTDPVAALGDPDVLVIRTSDILAFLARADEVSAEKVEELAGAVAEDDASDIIFTSGTTGKPKGVVATHGQSVGIFQTWADTVGFREGERMLVVAPFFHTFGYKAGLLACLLQRSTCVPLKVFDVDEALRTIAAERIDVVPGPPTLYSSLLEHPSLRQAPLNLRLAVTGAAVVPQELVRRMRTELGFAEVITAYGLTECTGLATACRPGDADEVISLTSGRAVEGVEVRVLAPVGQPGEVLVRGYGVTPGYWEDPEATAEAIDADGWLHTGDVGVMDAAGNLRITDRIKDMYVVGGFNAYPAEIEQVLVQHPGVSEAAVIGVPDERMGEVGKAFVVARAASEVDPDELVAWCRERLANYKVPRYVDVVEALPKNATGKVTKNVLRG
ncbi:MAG TPA: FadD3 family acyl-CoA ligase [Mycobacteriales bacterium]|nr:FadD3 family acyl-CoA ligase [Mycobacteriales bacterium]